MTDFFSIGMTKSEVMSKLGSTQATEKTKQFIQNFWNTDRDGKITNEIEQTMLNSWASGSEKVKMPTQGAQKINESKYDNGGVVYRYRSQSGNKHILTVWDNTKSFTMYNGKKYYTPDMLVTWHGNGQQDELFDKDGDGYADRRDVNMNFDKDINTTHIDEKMDGNLAEWDPNKIYF